jgi:hypothetical protein
MADIRIDIPDTLGLSEEQLKLLREKFQSDVIEILRAKPAGNVLAQARPEVQAVAQTMYKFILVDK